MSLLDLGGVYQKRDEGSISSTMSIRADCINELDWKTLFVRKLGFASLGQKLTSIDQPTFEHSNQMVNAG